MSELTTAHRSAPKGRAITIELEGCTVDAYSAVHHSGTGPGLLLLGDQDQLDAGLKARADLMGEGKPRRMTHEPGYVLDIDDEGVHLGSTR